MSGYSTTIKGVDVTIRTRAELFSPRRLDTGTAVMLDSVSLLHNDKVLDLGCGCGVVSIVCAKKIGAVQVFAIDSDPLAVQTTLENAKANGVGEITAVHSNGFSDFYESEFTKILCNPPYHSDFSVARQFILKGFNRLQIGGEFVFVTKRETWYRKKLRAVFGGSQSEERNGYFVISAQKRHSQYAKRQR